MNKLYKIMRVYEDGRKSRVIAENQTLEQAQKHCKNTETSSRTAEKGKGGCSCEWFDGYTRQ